jgi:hypothetical protein
MFSIMEKSVPKMERALKKRTVSFSVQSTVFLRFTQLP